MRHWEVCVLVLASILSISVVPTYAQLCPLTGCLTGNFYVLDDNLGIVKQYDSTGALLDANFITGLISPTSMAFDSAGNLYIPEFNLGIVKQYDSTGALLDANFITGSGLSFSIAIDSAGNIYVSTGTTVRKYDSTGALLDANFATGLSLAISIALDSAGNLYVADFILGTVRQYDSTGALLDANFITGLPLPLSIAFDSAGNIYVSENFFIQIRQYDSTGALLDANFITTLSIQNIAIAFDSAGNIYVANTGFNTVRQYDSTGALLDANFITGVFDPKSIAFDFSLVPDDVPPDQVTDLSLTVVSSTQVDLSWTTPDDGGSPITGYLIQRKIMGSPGETLDPSFGDATTTSFSDTTLSPGDTVQYRIAAINAIGQGPFSNIPPPVTTSGGASVPDQVTDLTLTVVSSTQVDLSWSIPADGGSPITGYLIQRKIMGSPGETLDPSFGDATTTSFSDTTLSPGDTVQYRIAAINAIGQGPFSNIPDTVMTSEGTVLDIVTANGSSVNVSVLLGNGDGTFGVATNFAVGSIPRSVAVGDFNNDGILDMVTANKGSSNVSVLLGTGTGTFGVATNFAVGDDPTSVAVGDFNNDGILDMVTANTVSNNVSVLLGTGTGTFGVATNFDVGSSVFVASVPISVAVGDFNNDGILDMVTANLSDNVSVLLGTGTGTFGVATNFDVGDAPVSVAVGDFNNDGILDMVTANNGSDNVSVLLGTGTGTFGVATNFDVGVELTTLTDDPASVAVGDFNNDGILDMVTANSGAPDSVSVLLGTGTGTFGVATNFDVAATNLFNDPTSVAVGDFNNDGILDMVTGNTGRNNVSVLLGTGTGTFGVATNFDVGTNPFSVAVGDFNP